MFVNLVDVTDANIPGICASYEVSSYNELLVLIDNLRKQYINDTRKLIVSGTVGGVDRKWNIK